MILTVLTALDAGHLTREVSDDSISAILTSKAFFFLGLEGEEKEKWEGRENNIEVFVFF